MGSVQYTVAGSVRGGAGPRAAGVFDPRTTVDSPLGGRQEPVEFLSETRGWLARHAARSREVHTVETPQRVVHELDLTLEVDGRTVDLPVMLIADVEDGCIRDLRAYHSTWPITGTHAVRHPILRTR